ncbi:unnamed protein product, partial [Effrenium voratum]
MATRQGPKQEDAIPWPAECAEECDFLSQRLFAHVDEDFDGLVALQRAREVLSEISEQLQSTLPEIASENVSPEVWSACMRSMCDISGERFQKVVREKLEEEPVNEPHILLGPVIGKVTESSARILLEASHDVPIRCVLKAESGAQAERRAELKRKRPQVIRFENLAKETHYELMIEGAVLLTTSSFRTLPAGGWRLAAGAQPCFAVASCNCIYETWKLRGADLWVDLKHRMEQGLQVDYFLHLGDNVYMDTDWHLIEKGKRTLQDHCKWGIARKMLEKVAKEKWHERTAEIEDHFQDVYRETWGHEPTRWVLAHVPNLMIYDDHEIRDDWGDRPEDKDHSSLDRFLGNIAYRITNSYQRVLHDDNVNPECDFHMHAFGDVGILFVDVRGCKTFHHKPDKDSRLPMLGQRQWDSFEAALDGGILCGCKALLVMLPEPIGYVSRANTFLIGHTVCDDLLGQWSAEAHRAEVPRFLKQLKAWRDSSAEKQLLLVAGDVHEGGWTDLILQTKAREGGEQRLRQLTTSAICNKMTSAGEALAVSLTRGVLSSIDVTDTGTGWCSRHYDWTNYRNYALVDVVWGTEGKLKVRVLRAQQLMESKDVLPWSSAAVALTVGEQTFTTHAVCDDTSPVWNSNEFEFAVKPTDFFLEVKVCDCDSLTGSHLGKTRLPIHGHQASKRQA